MVSTIIKIDIEFWFGPNELETATKRWWKAYLHLVLQWNNDQESNGPNSIHWRLICPDTRFQEGLSTNNRDEEN